jgi:hypothetical protein
MIYHGIRLKAREGVTPKQLEEAVESMREQGRAIPAVQSFIVGRDFRGDFDWSAMYVIEDLDGYWEYLTHPAHTHTDRIGMPLVENFESYDIADDEDPLLGEKIADLHRRRYENDPDLAAMVSQAP